MQWWSLPSSTYGFEIESVIHGAGHKSKDMFDLCSNFGFDGTGTLFIWCDWFIALSPFVDEVFIVFAPEVWGNLRSLVRAVGIESFVGVFDEIQSFLRIMHAGTASGVGSY